MLCVGQLLLLAVLVFTVTTALPGDAAEARLGEQYTPEQAAELRGFLHLNDPLTVRFADWLGGVLHGDLGRSLVNGGPVTGILQSSVAPTLILAGITLLIVVPLAAVLGFGAGVREGGRLDRTLTTATIAMQSVPDFVLAMLLIAALALQLGVLPATGVGVRGWGLLAQPAVLVLPVTVLVLRVVTGISRQVRAGTIDTLDTEYVAQASRLGVRRGHLLLRHVAPNAVGPAVQELVRVGDGLFGGVLVVEAVFAIPGLATALITGVQGRDVPVVQGLTLVLGVVTLLINLAADLTAHRLVPRTEQRR